MLVNSSYQTDAFVGTTLNIFKLEINHYPISFIIWNIALAIVAVILANWAAKIFLSKKKWFIKLGAILVWLALLPNTAYLMTDARHIIDYCPPYSYGRVCLYNAWMTLFFFAYASVGWPTFVLALRPLKKAMTKYFNKTIGLIFMFGACLLSALGVLLGLVNRFNSWNLITNPLKVIKVALTYFSDSVSMFNLFMMFIVLVFLYLVGEKIFINPKLNND